MSRRKRKLEELTTHHRRPKSLGGTRTPRNISRVKWKYHDAWNMLSENGTPERVAEILNDALAHLDKLKPKRREAFCLLFGNVSIQGIADIVNETWLDPDYELLLDADDVLIAAKKK